MSKPEVVAQLVRSGFVEGHHRGSVVALGSDGDVDWSVGAVDAPILSRSCLKPLQALGMLRLGLELPTDLIAIACASHSGEQIHLEAVRRLLDSAGLDDSALRTPPDMPLDDEERDVVLRAGGGPTSLQMNCSGKHAAMLATCVLHGWELETYLDPEHPLQRGIRATIEELTGETAQVAVDGCGAPVLSCSLTGLATAFRRLAVAQSGAERLVADAIRQHPELVSGTRRDERALLTAVPGSIGKAGAESCYVVALADGRAFALKIDDGSARARPVVMAAALRRSGVDQEQGVDAAALRRTGEKPLLGGGRVVGEISALL
ncbi:asparaginase [Nocardioides sp.]|uniref:asparaginase n=1 Tax=Nocardioides sp. TaxID=35761 RepID=UPI0037843535